MVKIKVKKLHDDAVIPKFMNDSDACADVTATSIEFKNDKVIYGIGLAVEIPKGYCMKIYPRSSINKTSLRLCNDVGIIDSNGKEFARGLTNYSSDEVERMKGLKTNEIEKALGYKDHDEVIHRDNLVIL